MPKSKKDTPERSELRVDYVHDRQVIIAPGRAKRHTNYNFTQAAVPVVDPANDAFSPERLQDVKALLTIGGQRHWRVKVIKNIFPAVSADNPKAYGYQEVIVETPAYGIELATLPEEHITDVLRAYASRVKALQRDKKIHYILVFKNNGGRAGATIDHAHSQIFATEYVPPHIITRRKRAQEYHIRHNTDYYSDLIIKEENGPRWITGGKWVCALTPYASLYNYEAWIMPWRRVDNISLMNAGELTEMARVLKKLLMRLNQEGLPYNYYLHQVVGDKYEHMYLRIAPRRDVWAGIELGSRLVVNTVAPEAAAKFYREAFKKS